VVKQLIFGAFCAKAKAIRLEWIVGIGVEVLQMVLDSYGRYGPPHGIISKFPDKFSMTTGAFVVTHILDFGLNVVKARGESQTRIVGWVGNGFAHFPRDDNPDKH
jgi:hypothetical protein